MSKIKSIGLIWENIEYGGMNTHVEDLLSSKNFLNKKITFFTNKNNQGLKSLKRNIVNKNVKFVLFTSLNSSDSKNFFIKSIFFIFKPFLFLASIIQFFFIMKNYKFDIFFATCGGYGGFRSDMAAIIATKLLKTQNIFMAIHHCYGSPKIWFLTIKIVNILIRNILSGLIFGSRAVKKNINKFTPFNHKIENQKVIHHGVKRDKYFNNKLDLKNIFFQKKNIYNVGLLSRIERTKGHMDLVESFYQLDNKIKNKFIFYFIGVDSKNEINALKKRINELKLNKYFIFTGFLNVSRSQIFIELDLLLSLTTNFEGFGLSVAEAMLYEVPIIATNVGAIPEFVNLKNGRLIRPGHIVDIVDALKDFVINNKSWKNKAKIAKKDILEKFSVAKMTSAYVDYFDNIVNINDSKNN